MSVKVYMKSNMRFIVIYYLRTVAKTSVIRQQYLIFIQFIQFIPIHKSGFTIVRIIKIGYSNYLKFLSSNFYRS